MHDILLGTGDSNRKFTIRSNGRGGGSAAADTCVTPETHVLAASDWLATASLDYPTYPMKPILGVNRH